MKLSQVFLKSERYIGMIVDYISPSKGDVFVEVGPGMGNFTFEFIGRGSMVVAIEFDKFFCQMLRIKGVDVVCEDYLKVNVLDEIKRRGYNVPVKFFSSIPYHITHSILVKLCGERNLYEKVFLILQMEVARKLLSRYNTKTYGSFSVVFQSLFNTRLVFNIPNKAFSPTPKVHSSFVEITPVEENFHIDSEKFLKFLNRFFRKRRRKMKNLHPGVPSNLDNLRPENIPPEQWLNLYKFLL